MTTIYTCHAAQHTHRDKSLSSGACYAVCCDGVPIAATKRIGGRTVLLSGEQSVTFAATPLDLDDEDERQDFVDLVADASQFPRAVPAGENWWSLDLSGANLSRTLFAKAHQ